MKRLFIISLTILLISSNLISQSCLPEGIEITTQSQIDNFAQNYPNCKIIEGYVYILGSDITNLQGLSQLTKIGGYLAIGDYMSGNDNLHSLEGLNNIKEINALQIEGNDNLLNLSGLDSLEIINFGLWVDYNARIKDLSGMKNLKNINGHIQINTNYSLTSISALSDIPSHNIELLLIENNASLSFCEIESVCNILSDSIASIAIFMNGEGCRSSNEVRAACNALGVANSENNNIINIFPNPADSRITISTSYLNENKEIKIYNSYGELLIDLSSNANSIDISKLPNGLHIIEIIAGSQTLRERILIIK